MKHTGTYSPEDNKLRMYPAHRLSPEDYARVKSAGFKWAPKQELFVAPMWTPNREDLLLEFCDEIGDEDTSLVDRAEERSERFEEYSEHRAADAHRAREAVSAIADNIPLGQPILVGHHSEKHARRDAEKIQNGMRKAIKMWETSKYWEDRAAGAIASAKYKERPDVRHRRIKGLESDLRKQNKTLTESAAHLSAWQEPGLTHEKARSIAGGGYGSSLYRCYPLAKYPRNPPASQYEGEMSLWSALGDTPEHAVISVAQAVEIAVRAHQGTIPWCNRWIQHYENRLKYERAMLNEAGGLKADGFDLAIGGQILASGKWLTIVKINKAGEHISSVSTNNRSWPRVVSVEDIRDYRPPTEELAAQVKEAVKLPPICNYKATLPVRDRWDSNKPTTMTVCTEITQAEWDRTHKDYKSTRVVEAADGLGRHRVRTMVRKGCLVPVFISDAKMKDPPRVTNPEPIPELPPIEKDLATAQREAERRLAFQEKIAPTEFDAMKDSLKAGVVAVAAPQLFPTPAELADQVVELALLEPGQKILEPSAGTGNLVRAILKAQPDAKVHCVELNSKLSDLIIQSDLPVTVQWRDFLELTPEDPKGLGTIGLFDRIVMNPPFVQGSDIKHIEHALKFLKPGGRLVSICANGPRQRAAFEERATRWIDLPAGSFESQGTGVNTAIVVFDA